MCGIVQYTTLSLLLIMAILVIYTNSKAVRLLVDMKLFYRNGDFFLIKNRWNEYEHCLFLSEIDENICIVRVYDSFSIEDKKVDFKDLVEIKL